jgi:hypothetical protein
MKKENFFPTNLYSSKLCIDLLKRQSFHSIFLKRVINIDNTLDLLVQANIFVKDVDPISQYLWAMGIILSRGLSSINSPFTLVPFIDFANHADDGYNFNANHGFHNESRTFHLTATKEIISGESIRINYGQERPMESFLILYGFLESNIPKPVDVFSYTISHNFSNINNELFMELFQNSIWESNKLVNIDSKLLDNIRIVVKKDSIIINFPYYYLTSNNEQTIILVIDALLRVYKSLYLIRSNHPNDEIFIVGSNELKSLSENIKHQLLQLASTSSNKRIVATENYMDYWKNCCLRYLEQQVIVYNVLKKKLNSLL